MLCCATFPLLWIGGLITTTDAGMAVPDWPGTYGYNLFLYPWQTWLFGPLDLFLEHGHRLYASGVGLLTIAFLVVVWRSGPGPRLRRLAVATLALVIFQGVLGGLRVVFNERHLALIHGSTGPLYFALTAALVVLTARACEPRPSGSDQPIPPIPPAPQDPPAQKPARWTWLLPALIYFQLVLGAAMRHVPEDSSFSTFAQHVQTHLWGALVVTLLVLLNGVLAWRGATDRSHRVLAGLMVAVVLAQGSLGVAAWVAKYRLPDWAQTGLAADAWAAAVGPGTMSPSTAGGWSETHVVTGHSANGSLLLALATAHALVAARRGPVAPDAAPADPPPSR